MQPKLKLLNPNLVERILDEAFQLLVEPGVNILNGEARELLTNAGAQTAADSKVLQIPEKLIWESLENVPKDFYLYDQKGKPAVHYGGDDVHFDPGSSGLNVLDSETLDHRPARTPDLVKLIKVAEMLPQFAAQSTAVVCSEVPKAIGDLYRLYLVMMLSNKPVVTGAFSTKTPQTMFDMLAIFAGGRKALARKPTAIFDVCPTPPLIWTDFAAQNLIMLARAGVPAQMVPMPLAGVAGPVTLLGSIVQHAVESLSGIVIHQLASPGAPIVWGGAPTIFEMRHGTTPMGAVETAMIDAAYAQVGKSLGLPTHAYLGASDAKIMDAQAGMQSGMTALIGALGGINMISGAGMLDFLVCQSAEKLVIDAEGIAMAQRLLDGFQVRTDTLATEFFAGFNFKADFLYQEATRDLFRLEQVQHSRVIDRGSLDQWQLDGSKDTFSRARDRVMEIVDEYQRPEVEPEKESALIALVSSFAKQAGMEKLPDLEL
jgi:trimethylamine--corrinoid protein Co-methyltransferase